MPEQPIFSINESECLKQKALCIDGLKKIPFDSSFATLKQVAATGTLIFKNKKLVVDLFSKASFSYFIAEEGHDYKVSGVLTFRNQEFSLDSLDFLALGRTSWFIKGFQLGVIDENISIASLKTRILKQKELAAFIDEAKEDGISVKGLDDLIIKKHEPLPLLKLSDRTGAFANLWMDYGSDGAIPFDAARNCVAEQSWENDLLETDYLKKIVGNTSYYCPLDKVAKSLTFLLEIGWKIQDCNGKKVIRESHNTLHADIYENRILVSGEVQYDSFKTDVKNVAGAFVRKERFLNLDENTVGLISDSPAGSEFLEDGEIVAEGIALNRYSIKEFIENQPIPFSPNLRELKDKIKPLSFSKSFKGSLRPYQIKGTAWLLALYQMKLGGILADDMGLGKTIQVLAFLAELDFSLCHVIVVPTSLIFNWHAEIKKFLPDIPCSIHHGSNRSDELINNGVIITSYAMLRQDLHLFLRHPIECLILDEAQAIKNQDTKTAKALGQLSCQFRLSLTGTPIENHIDELFSHFHFLMPGFLNESTDKLLLKKLQKKIQPFFLRRSKEEVLHELPEKIEQTVFVEMAPAQRRAYDSYLSAFKKNVLSKIHLDGVSKHKVAIFEALLRLRQICCHPMLVDQDSHDCGKLEALMEDLTTLISHRNKGLIFSQFTSMLDLIAKELRQRGIAFTRLDGETKDREKVVTEFQESDEIPLFLISLKAGGVGLNLTKADHVFIYDPWWNDAVENQAISRAHRIGQENKVLAKRYITVESIEEKILKLKEAKNKLIEELFTENSLTDHELLSLFE